MRIKLLEYGIWDYTSSMLWYQSQIISKNQNIRLDSLVWGVTAWPEGTHSGSSELSPVRFEMIPWNRSYKLKPYIGSFIFTWVSTTPNRKAPIVRKNPAKRRRALDLSETRAGSFVRVVCQRQTPGNMKMKTAARQPRRSITTPMFGISMANTKEATNLRIKNSKYISWWIL